MSAKEIIREHEPSLTLANNFSKDCWSLEVKYTFSASISMSSEPPLQF